MKMPVNVQPEVSMCIFERTPLSNRRQLWWREICRPCPCQFQTCSEIRRVLRDWSRTLSIRTLEAEYGRSTQARRGSRAPGDRNLLSCPGDRFLWDSWQQGTWAPAPGRTKPAGSGLFTMKPNSKRKVSLDSCYRNSSQDAGHLSKGKKAFGCCILTIHEYFFLFFFS